MYSHVQIPVHVLPSSLCESHDYTHVQPCSIPDYPPPSWITWLYPCTAMFKYQYTYYPPPFVNHMTIPMYSHVQYQTTLLPSRITWLYPCTLYSHVRTSHMNGIFSIMWLYPKHTPKLSPNWTLNELYTHTSVKMQAYTRYTHAHHVPHTEHVESSKWRSLKCCRDDAVLSSAYLIAWVSERSR